MLAFTTGHIITSVSVFVVLVTFVIGYFERRTSERRRRTFDFLMCIMEEEGPIHQANLKFALWIRDDRVIEDGNIDVDDRETIVELIDFYDLLSDSAMRGVVDKEMVILHLGGRMRSTYQMLEKYIEARRDTLGRQGLYHQFEKFVTECVGDREV